jgi:hypothetical protein
MRRSRLGFGLVAAGLALAACSSSGTKDEPGTPVDTTRTVIQTRTTTLAPTFTPRPAAPVKPLKPGADPRTGEKDKPCPYIRSGLDEDPTSKPNVADIEGDRIYRTTVTTTHTPVGCRFYFYAPPYEAVAEIRPTTFATATDARDAMILTAQAGTSEITEKGFVAGVDGILFRTKFFGPDGAKDWAFAFAKGKVLVVVYTQRKDTSRNALYLGQAIAAKF